MYSDCYTKNVKQQKNINMAVAEYIGHDHNGKPLYKVDTNTGVITDDILDDTDSIISEIDCINNKESFIPKYTFQVDADKIGKSGILVPRYYWNSKVEEIKENAEKCNIDLIPMNQLIKENIIKYFDGNGSPKSDFKGTGDIPYIRVKDIVNWQIYKDPTALIPESEFNRLYKEEKN